MRNEAYSKDLESVGGNLCLLDWPFAGCNSSTNSYMVGMANKIGMLLSEAMNSNAVINTCLGVSFVVLGLRSDKQQKYVEAFVEQKDSLFKSNKEMKVTMWEWKQQLYAEAASAGDSAVVPLSTLKAIYSEIVATTQSGDTAKEESKVSTPKIMV